MQNSSPIPGSIVRGAVVVIITSILLFAFSKGLAGHNYTVVYLTFGIPFILYLINHRPVWLMLTFGSFYSWIYIPGFPSSLSLFYILAGSLTLIMLASRLMKTGGYTVGRLTFFATCWYLAVLLITMYARGFGIQMFGEGQWGGAGYIQLMIVIGFYMLHDTVPLSEKNWKTVIILFFCAGVIPSVAEMIFILSRGSISFLYMFIRPDGVSAFGGLAAFNQHSGVLRFQVAKYIAMILPLALALMPYRGRYKKYIIFSGLMAFIFAGMSGHRSAVLFIILFVPAFMYTRGLRWRPGNVITIALGALLFMLVLYLSIKVLPLSVQRAFSWIPFLDISSTAKSSATGTFNWRLMLWGRLWHMVPDYLLIGRGFAFKAVSITSSSGRHLGGVDWAIITHNYHNGPLSLIIDLGLAGFISGSLIFITGLTTQLKFRKKSWSSEKLSRYHAVLCAVFVVEMLRFYVIHGSAVSSIVLALVHLSMMEGIVRTDMLLAKKSESKTDSPNSEENVMPNGLREY